MSSLGSIGGSSFGGLGGTGLSTSGLNFTGLASGIDTNSIIQGLLKLQQANVDRLQSNEDAVAAQQNAFKDIDTKLLAFQGTVDKLNQSFNGAFDGRTATSSNTNLATAAASSGAAPGVYSFRVTSLAQAQQLASQGFQSPTSAINQGTFTVQVGSGAATTVTIGPGNNTLQGLAAAINQANGDVTAAIINDGSDPRGAPYRLVLTSKKSGAANTINITNNLTTGGAVQPNLATASVGAAVAGVNDTSTSAVTSGVSGSYTGGNKTYTITVDAGGAVGSGTINLHVTDQTGANLGSFSLAAGYAGGAVSVPGGNGLTLAFGSGSLSTGDTFKVQGYSPALQQASDASVTVGSGAGALTVNSPTNQVNNLFSGVTLNLQGADPNTTVNLTVANDTATAKGAITDFVKAYNDLMSYIGDKTKFDEKTQTAGILLGNNSVADIRNQLSGTLNAAVAGINPLVNHLSALGISPDASGQLTVDSTKLDQALNGQVAGVSYSDLRALFPTSGVSTNSGIQFSVAGDKTLPSGATPYGVTITQAATQGSVLGTNALSGSVVITPSNNTFTLNVNGQAATVTINPGSYTPYSLSQALQSAINANPALAGNSVAVNLDPLSHLQITSQLYGASSTVGGLAGTALGALGFTGGETGLAGKDVAGQFVVNGVTEAATGSGQVLKGNAGNAHTDGLQVLVALSAPGSGNLTVTRGLASQLEQVINRFVDPVNGRLATIDRGFQDQIKQIQDNIARQNVLVNQQKDSLTQQFAAMEAQISQLKAVGQTVAQFGVAKF